MIIIIIICILCMSYCYMIFGWTLWRPATFLPLLADEETQAMMGWAVPRYGATEKCVGCDGCTTVDILHDIIYIWQYIYIYGIFFIYGNIYIYPSCYIFMIYWCGDDNLISHPWLWCPKPCKRASMSQCNWIVPFFKGHCSLAFCWCEWV